MARYKPQESNNLLLPVVLSDQLIPGSFAFALDYLVDNELNLTTMDAQFNNDEVGASAYDPRVMLKIVLLAYSQGLISSRSIEQVCQRIGTVEPMFSNIRHKKRLATEYNSGRYWLKVTIERHENTHQIRIKRCAEVKNKTGI